jgi:tryptophan-rich sensory protein
VVQFYCGVCPNKRNISRCWKLLLVCSCLLAFLCSESYENNSQSSVKWSLCSLFLNYISELAWNTLQLNARLPGTESHIGRIAAQDATSMYEKDISHAGVVTFLKTW